MRFLTQNVTYARVTVGGKSVGEIEKGLLVFVGISDGDTEEIASKMVKKLLGLRIFADDEGKTNLSVSDVSGELLLISQFTLYADCRKGNRPSFTNAAKPDEANKLYEYIIDECKSNGMLVSMGIFGADMKVELCNDGPFTVMLDSDEIIKH